LTLGRLIPTRSLSDMAATRERRANAGNKMARLLEDEEEDEFYTTTYGGFDEVLY